MKRLLLVLSLAMSAPLGAAFHQSSTTPTPAISNIDPFFNINAFCDQAATIVGLATVGESGDVPQATVLARVRVMLASLCDLYVEHPEMVPNELTNKETELRDSYKKLSTYCVQKYVKSSEDSVSAFTWVNSLRNRDLNEFSKVGIKIANLIGEDQKKNTEESLSNWVASFSPFMWYWNKTSRNPKSS